VTEPRNLRASGLWGDMSVHGAGQVFRLGRQGKLLRPAWVFATPDEGRAAQSLPETEATSTLGKLAFASLWLLVFAIPWENSLMIPGIGTGARLIGIFASGISALAIIEKGRVRVPSPGHVMMGLFTTWAALSYLWSVNPEVALTQVFSYFQLLVMAWMIWELACRAQDQTRLMQAYVLGTFISSIDTAHRYLSHRETVYQRYAGAGFNPNELALIMALSIPISYYLLIESKGWIAWIYRLQLVLAGTTVVLSASRGGGVASLVALAVVPLTYARLTRPQIIANILMVGVLVWAGLVFVPATSWERLSSIPEEFSQGTLNGRTVIWKAGLDVFSAHPFLGVGPGGFTESLRHMPYPQSAHNTYLSVLVEEGVIGFGFFCAWIAVVALSVKEMPPLPQKLWIVFLGAWVVGVSVCTQVEKPTWFFFTLLMTQWACVVQKRSPGGNLLLLKH
jgi:O-antigen ligase